MFHRLHIVAALRRGAEPWLNKTQFRRFSAVMGAELAGSRFGRVAQASGFYPPLRQRGRWPRSGRRGPLRQGTPPQSASLTAPPWDGGAKATPYPKACDDPPSAPLCVASSARTALPKRRDLASPMPEMVKSSSGVRGTWVARSRRT
ncbi:MAG: hypothetical protein RLZZ157_1614 [Pseudomonadota bacterium]